MQIIERLPHDYTNRPETFLIKKYDFLSGKEKLCILKTSNSCYIKSTIKHEIYVSRKKLEQYKSELGTGVYSSPEHSLISISKKIKRETGILNVSDGRLRYINKYVLNDRSLKNDILCYTKASEFGIAPKLISWDPDYTSYIIEYIDNAEIRRTDAEKIREAHKRFRLGGYESITVNAGSMMLVHNNKAYFTDFIDSKNDNRHDDLEQAELGHQELL